MKQKTMKQPNVVYIAKKLLEYAEGGKAVFISTPGKISVGTKNNNIEALLACFKKNNKKVVVVNYDATYKPSDLIKDDVVDAVSVADSFSLHFDQVSAKLDTDNDLVLVNIPPVITSSALFDKSMEIDHIVFNVEYGRTKYVDFEKALDIVKENNITVLGVIANKY